MHSIFLLPFLQYLPLLILLIFLCFNGCGQVPPSIPDIYDGWKSSCRPLQQSRFLRGDVAAKHKPWYGCAKRERHGACLFFLVSVDRTENHDDGRLHGTLSLFHVSHELHIKEGRNLSLCTVNNLSKYKINSNNMISSTV